MYGDPAAMRIRVDQLREQAVDVRAAANQIVARAEAIEWRGRAANSMRVRMAERASQLRESAGRHEVAADSLARHAAEVSRLKEAIATIEARAVVLVAEATSRLAQAASSADLGAADRASREDDHRTAGFVSPRPGHRSWLSIELPECGR